MARDPAFQFYASDWLGSTLIALMTAEQERGYLRLLCHIWNSPDCALPDDDSVLARLSLMGEGWLNGGCHLVRQCLIEHPEKQGAITNEKLLLLRRERDAWRQKSAAGGRKSAQSRQSTDESKGGTKGGSTTLEREHPTNRQPKGNTPSPSPSPSNKNTPPISPPRGTYPKSFLAWWEAYPRKVGKAAAARAYKRAGSRLRIEHDLDSETAAQRLLDCAREFAASDLGRDKQFCPHPASWLNDGRYDDDRTTWDRATETSPRDMEIPRL